MTDMAKKPTNDKEAPQSHQIAFRLPPDLYAALAKFMASQRVPPTQTDTVIVALQEFLHREGFYPDSKQA